jgi:hypothetical protein
MPPVIIILISLTAIGAIAAAIANHRTTIVRWTDAATQLGLDVVGGGTFSQPRLDGLVAGHAVSVHTFTSGGGNNQTRYTRFEVKYPALGLGLELSRQTKVGGFFRRVVGLQDVEVGDHAFDEAFIVKASAPENLSTYLTGPRRVALERLVASFPSLKVTDTFVRVDVRKVERDADALVSTVRRLVSVAQNLGGAGASGDLDRAVAARETGDLGEAVRRMRAAVEAQPDDVERRLIEIDTLAAAGDLGDLETRVMELDQLAPADPEVRGWKNSIASPTAPLREQMDVEPSAVDAAAATADLFGGREMSFVVRDRFAADYAGKRVRWSGTVRKVRSYDFDADFGRGPGVKAVVTVAALEHDLFGTTEVDAIVQLPESVIPEQGSTVTFVGTLSGADALMRNFTVRQATLV